MDESPITSDDSEEEDDLPPTPFISAIRAARLNVPIISSRVVNEAPLDKALTSDNLIPTSVSSISTETPTVISTVTVSDDVVSKEKERKHQLIKNIVKRNRDQNTDIYNEADVLLERIKQGGIVAKISTMETDTTEVTAEPHAEQELVNEDEEENFNSPPGLSVFVQSINFFAEIKAPTITNSNDPFEADLLTAPPKILRELVISNTILSIFNQKPVPTIVVNWLVAILLKSDDKILSQAALSTLTNLLHQTKMCSLPVESFHITYTDVVKFMAKFGANINAEGDIQSTISSPSDFLIFEYKEKELLINNLSNFIKYLATLLTMFPEVSSLVLPEKLIALLLRVSLDHHVIDSILNIAIIQCTGAVLSCYCEEEWNSTKVDQLCQSLLAITDDYHNWYKIVTNIGNITTRSRQLQKQFARTVIRTKTVALMVPDDTSDLDFVIAFVQTLFHQKEKYNLNLLYCLLDVLFMLIDLEEISKEKDSDCLSNLIDYLSLLSNNIHDNPKYPITGFVKSSVLRLRNVLLCTSVSVQQLQRNIFPSNEKVKEYKLVRVGSGRLILANGRRIIQ